MDLRACPSEQEMQAFQLGDLPEDRLDQVAEHLERCRRCEQLAQRLDAQKDQVLSAIFRPPATATQQLKTATPPQSRYSPVLLVLIVLAAALGFGLVRWWTGGTPDAGHATPTPPVARPAD